MPTIPNDYIIAGILVPLFIYAIVKLWQAYQRMVNERIQDLKGDARNDQQDD